MSTNLKEHMRRFELSSASRGFNLHMHPNRNVYSNSVTRDLFHAFRQGLCAATPAKQTDKQKLISLLDEFGVEYDTTGKDVMLHPANPELTGQFYFNDDDSFKFSC